MSHPFTNYRELLKAETLEFRVAMHYPMFWNDHQEWVFSFVATKVSVRFIYAVKWFFQVTRQVKILCWDCD